MNIEQILKMPIETLLAVFFNATINSNRDFEIQSNYRESKFLSMPNDTYKLTAEQLTKKYKIHFSQINGTTIVSEIKNEKGWNIDTFLNAIYRAIITKINKTDKIDIEMALAMFIFRGSADFNRGLYAVDIKREISSKRYMDNLFKLLLSTDELLSRLNLNFRELQPQFISSQNKRNTQIRINLKWFFDKVLYKFKDINKYKFDILNKNITDLGDVKIYPSFENRIVFYRENCLGRKLKKSEIKSLREELNFSRYEYEKATDFDVRNQKIVSYAREVLPDECVACKDKFPIDSRSFKMPRNNRYFFEINHVIPWANDSKIVDVFDNLVKLCPTCHRALTPRRAYESLQKNIIEKMINSRMEVKQFITSMNKNTDLADVDYVYSMLK